MLPLSLMDTYYPHSLAPRTEVRVLAVGSSVPLIRLLPYLTDIGFDHLEGLPDLAAGEAEARGATHVVFTSPAVVPKGVKVAAKTLVLMREPFSLNKARELASDHHLGFSDPDTAGWVGRYVPAGRSLCMPDPFLVPPAQSKFRVLLHAFLRDLGFRSPMRSTNMPHYLSVSIAGQEYLIEQAVASQWLADELGLELMLNLTPTTAQALQSMWKGLGFPAVTTCHAPWRYSDIHLHLAPEPGIEAPITDGKPVVSGYSNAWLPTETVVAATESAIYKAMRYIWDNGGRRHLQQQQLWCATLHQQRTLERWRLFFGIC